MVGNRIFLVLDIFIANILEYKLLPKFSGSVSFSKFVIVTKFINRSAFKGVAVRIGYSSSDNVMFTSAFCTLFIQCSLETLSIAIWTFDFSTKI